MFRLGDETKTVGDGREAICFWLIGSGRGGCEASNCESVAHVRRCRAPPEQGEGPSTVQVIDVQTAKITCTPVRNTDIACLLNYVLNLKDLNLDRYFETGFVQPPFRTAPLRPPNDKWCIHARGYPWL